LKLHEYDSFDLFLKNIKSKSQLFYLTRYGTKSPEQVKFSNKLDAYLIFGKESIGLPKELLKQNVANTIRIPASKNIRSLNLANCVAILGYEYMKQNGYVGLELEEPHKPLFKK
jgi:tRNA (cytidine/uridine-2'-O-)-methyltransferase